LGAGHITIVVKRTGFRSAAFVAKCHKPCTAATCLLPRSLCAGNGMKYLSRDEIYELINSLDGEDVNYERVRPHNKGEIRTPGSKTKTEFKRFIADAIEEEHQLGGDIEVLIPSINKVLVGHHDGLYWLE